MIKNAVSALRDAAAQGAQVACLQELFYGPYFCQVQDPQWYSWTEEVPDGPTVRLMQDVAREHHMVLIVPVYEREQVGVYDNTAAVIDADGTFLGKHRKNHLPHVTGFWEKFYPPATSATRCFDTAVGRIGVYIYERHFPEGWRGASACCADPDRVQPVGDQPGPVGIPVEAGAARGRVPPTSTSSCDQPRLVSAAGGLLLLRVVLLRQPARQLVGGSASDSQEEVVVRDLDMGLLEQVLYQRQFYRDRRPEHVWPCWLSWREERAHSSTVARWSPRPGPTPRTCC